MKAVWREQVYLSLSTWSQRGDVPDECRNILCMHRNCGEPDRKCTRPAYAISKQLDGYQPAMTGDRIVSTRTQGEHIPFIGILLWYTDTVIRQAIMDVSRFSRYSTPASTPARPHARPPYRSSARTPSPHPPFVRPAARLSARRDSIAKQQELGTHAPTNATPTSL